MKKLQPILPPEVVLQAYANGIFPMAEGRDSEDVFWVDPTWRGVLPLDGFHISRSLARRMRQGGYEITLNRDLAGVLDGCAEREETWINDRIREIYLHFYATGFCHSLEVWHEGELTGGVYGVAMGGAFFGESMFSRRRDASKLALAYLTDHLRRCGFVLFDTQFITAHLASLGAVEIPRSVYHEALQQALQIPVSILDKPLCTDPYSVLQRNSQTS